MNSVERQWKQLQSAMNVTIKDVYRKKEQTIRNPWFTAACQKMIDERRVVKLKWLASKNADDEESKQRSEQLKENYHETNRITKLLLRRCKRSFLVKS